MLLKCFDEKKKHDSHNFPNPKSTVMQKKKTYINWNIPFAFWSHKNIFLFLGKRCQICQTDKRNMNGHRGVVDTLIGGSRVGGNAFMLTWLAWADFSEQLT